MFIFIQRKEGSPRGTTGTTRIKSRALEAKLKGLKFRGTYRKSGSRGGIRLKDQQTAYHIYADLRRSLTPISRDGKVPKSSISTVLFARARIRAA